ncbi:hypothetical protein ELUMI_v1c03780 [Williamsoniiplasma luminosum]|uniref:Uncharacterized protein n=1 Tax=Williamsoniiplasma luminosum TaxID=214888 RepID=A0A2K8NWV0_9MOLU|nr:hypothetical protein [Williamsoniiplasma luminosum]ATZ17103.1 hypothetical protein ELUMI_v1c03780 [Williamsoniiplasma luminosum]
MNKNAKGITVSRSVWIGIVAFLTLTQIYLIVLSAIDDQFGLWGIIEFSIFLVIGVAYLISFVLYHKDIIKGKIWKYLFPNKKPVIYKDVFKLNWINFFTSQLWIALGIACSFILPFDKNGPAWYQGAHLLWSLVITWFILGGLGMIGAIGAIITNYSQRDWKKYTKYFALLGLVPGIAYTVYEFCNRNNSEENELNLLNINDSN